MSLSPSAQIYDNYTGDTSHKTNLYKYMQDLEAQQSTSKMCGQKGGFLGLFEGGIGKYLGAAKKSERALVKSHQKMSDTIAEWTKTYDKHLANLVKLDEFMSMGDSLQTIFKDILMKNYFRKFGDKIDTSIPLFLENYVADKDSTPNDFKREHIEKQIWFVLYTEFGQVERELIKYIEVRILDDEKVQAIFRTVENKVHERTFHHTKLNLGIPSVRTALDDILKSAKSDMSFNINEIKKKESEVPSYMIRPDMGNEALKKYLSSFNINMTKKNTGGKTEHNSTLYSNASKKIGSLNITGKDGVNANNKKGPLKPHEKDFNPSFGLLDRQKANNIAKKEAEIKAKANAVAAAAGLPPPGTAAPIDITKQLFPGINNQTKLTDTTLTPAVQPQTPASIQNALSEIKTTQFGPPAEEPKPFSIITNDLQQKLSPAVVPATTQSGTIIPEKSILCFNIKSKEECLKHNGYCKFNDKSGRCSKVY